MGENQPVSIIGYTLVSAGEWTNVIQRNPT